MPSVHIYPSFMVLPRTVAQRREDLEAAVGIRADESTTPLMLSDLAEKLRQEDMNTFLPIGFNENFQCKIEP